MGKEGGSQMKEKSEEKLGLAFRRKGEYLDIRISVLLPWWSAQKTFRAIFQSEKQRYEHWLKSRKGKTVAT